MGVGLPYLSMTLPCGVCGGQAPIRSTYACSACGQTVHQRCGRVVEVTEANCPFVCVACLPAELLLRR